MSFANDFFLCFLLLFGLLKIFKNDFLGSKSKDENELEKVEKR